MSTDTIYNVIQDGRSFYLFDADAAIGEGVTVIIECPQTMFDYDFAKAKEARSWFYDFANKHNMLIQFKDNRLHD